ncbi:MAG: aspartate/glutamate racemase family protein [Ignavibacteriales bacterium]
MEKRILWVNPLGTDVFDAPTREYLRRNAGPGVTVDVVSFPRGPRHLEYHYYSALMLPGLLHSIKLAERNGYDGAIIGCFYDPGLREAREITDRLVVTAPEEAALHIASTLGERFSVIAVRDKCIPAMRDNAVRYGFGEKIASFKSLGLGVHDLHGDDATTMSRLERCAQEAVERDGAEVIILGCTITYGFFRELQDALRVPVIDAMLAPLEYIQLLIEVKRRFDWGHSKRLGYESPPVEEIYEWGLDRDWDCPRLWG